MIKTVTDIYSPPASEKAKACGSENSGASFSETLESAVCARDEQRVKPPEKKEEGFWELRKELAEKHFEQRDELYKKKQLAKLQEERAKAQFGPDYKGPTPTLSAAEILFDLLDGGGL